MKDFDDMATLAREVQQFFPNEPDLAMEHFQETYSHLISMLIVGMSWNYLEAERLLKNGLTSLNDPFANTRKWRPQDMLNNQHKLRN
jgi:hypothetical protein